LIDVDVVVLDEELELPDYARPGDAGADLIAREDALLEARGGRAVVATGIALALPLGTAGFVLPRSGLAANHGITCLNAPGLIDSGYRGEIRVVLVNTDPTTPYQVRRGDRIAQLVVLSHDAITFRRVLQLEDSERGQQGFGHSGR
jgi:dUTP pyrophosphatase